MISGDEMTPELDADMRQLAPCAKCLAGKGKPCTTPSGGRRYPHTVRERGAP